MRSQRDGVQEGHHVGSDQENPKVAPSRWRVRRSAQKRARQKCWTTIGWYQTQLDGTIPKYGYITTPGGAKAAEKAADADQTELHKIVLSEMDYGIHRKQAPQKAAAKKEFCIGDDDDDAAENITHLKNEINTKFDTKVDHAAWKKANGHLDAAIETVRDMVSSLRLDVDARRRKVDETEAWLKNDIRQKQQEVFEKIGAVEQQAELRSAEVSRRLGALDLRMNGVQGGLGEHKRDILRLCEEMHGLTAKSTLHDDDIQKNSDAIRNLEARDPGGNGVAGTRTAAAAAEQSVHGPGGVDDDDDGIDWDAVGRLQDLQKLVDEDDDLETDAGCNRIRFKSTGHEMQASLKLVQDYMNGRKYRKAIASKERLAREAAERAARKAEEERLARAAAERAARKAEDRVAAKTAAAARAAAEKAATERTKQGPPPPEWETVFDASQERWYYQNIKTRESRWTQPECTEDGRKTWSGPSAEWLQKEREMQELFLAKGKVSAAAPQSVRDLRSLFEGR